MKIATSALLCGTLLPSVAAKSFKSFFDHVCPDQTHCLDDESCCPLGVNDGYMCCEKTASGACCGGGSKAGGGCCGPQETCCSDDEDYSCCLQQNTFCVDKDPSVPSLPSRCCPRWTIGCTTGSVGCCDPAQPWQWYLQTDADRAVAGHSTSHTVGNASFAGNLTAYVLVVNGMIGGLEGMAVDVATGTIESHTRIIKSFDDDPAGESTREFMFDSKRKVFYYVDANFTANGGERPESGREMYLYAVDPVSGATHKQTVSGAVDFPVGYTYHAETDTIIIGVEQVNANETSVQGFDYFSLNPETAEATRLSTISRGSSETDPAFYAGFHRHASVAGDIVYRLGYEEVSKQTGQGLGVISLNEAHANATWLSEISPLHDYYMTLNRAPATSQASQASDSDVFISLAPREGLGHNLDVVQWNADDGGKSAKIIAQLSNAHVPSIRGLGAWPLL